MFPEPGKNKETQRGGFGAQFRRKSTGFTNFRELAASDYRRRLGFSSKATASTWGDHRNWSIGVTLFKA